VNLGRVAGSGLFLRNGEVRPQLLVEQVSGYPMNHNARACPLPRETGLQDGAAAFPVSPKTCRLRIQYGKSSANSSSGGIMNKFEELEEAALAAFGRYQEERNRVLVLVNRLAQDLVVFWGCQSMQLRLFRFDSPGPLGCTPEAAVTLEDDNKWHFGLGIQVAPNMEVQFHLLVEERLPEGYLLQVGATDTQQNYTLDRETFGDYLHQEAKTALQGKVRDDKPIRIGFPQGN